MTNKMWGGRFQSGPDAIMEEINASIGFDKRLFRQDIAGSKAHAAMLADAGILTKADAKEITKGLDAILGEIEAGTFKYSRSLEDVHMNVESRLKDMIGAAAGVSSVTSKTNVAPRPGVLSTESVPSIAFARRCEIARPNPTPLGWRGMRWPARV